MPRLLPVPDLSMDDTPYEGWFDTYTVGHNYYGVAGASRTAAASIDVAASYHPVTGTTTIDNLNDPAGARAGQRATFKFASALTIRHNGGGTGNIRTMTHQDKVVVANQVVSFVYDGTVWREAATTPSVDLDYVELNSRVTIPFATAASEDDAFTLVTSHAREYDGTMAVMFEFFVPEMHQGSTDATITFVLFEDDEAIGILGEFQRPGDGWSTAMTCRRRWIPPEGEHVYRVKAWVTVSDATVTAGSATGGGTGVNRYMPVYLRITSV
jgi:hypothetical protein